MINVPIFLLLKNIDSELYKEERHLYYLSIFCQFRDILHTRPRVHKKEMFRRERIKELLKRFRNSRTFKREIKVVRSYWVTAETFEVSNFENLVGEPARASQYQQKKEELA